MVCRSALMHLHEDASWRRARSLRSLHSSGARCSLHPPLAIIDGGIDGLHAAQ
jgi:hypothetical protein